MNKNRKSGRLTGSTGARIIVFFLLAISTFIGAAGTLFTILLYGMGYGNKAELISDLMWETASDELDLADNNYFWQDDTKWLEDYFSERNSGIELYVEETKIWSCYDGGETPYVYTRYGTVPPTWGADSKKDTQDSDTSVSDTPGTRTATQDISTDSTEKELRYTMYLYVDEAFPYNDAYSMYADFGDFIYGMRSVLPVLSVVSILVFFICFVFLMCSAGHKTGEEGIVPGVLTELPFDLLTFAFGFVALLGVFLLYYFITEYPAEIIVIASLFIAMVEAVWCTLYCMEFALRLKQGKFWRNTIIFKTVRWFYRLVRWFFRALGTLLRGIPFVINTVIAFLAICILEFMGILIFCNVEVFILWLLEKIVLLPIVLYFSLVCKKLQQGSEALAEGNLSYHVDTSKMILDFKEHGENLNSIGEGISRAVEERMKSEHLKTELITNVSHDLKTPLTSIINYADLLGSAVQQKDETDLSQVAEYSEVLLRQSKRLKKLLEDLVEASKATTGNLEVNLVPCEIGVLLSQAVGEYEQRFGEKQLELITKQPEEPVRIQADGKHLWRIFDNLLNNIYKYAQENTRVYLSVEKKEDRAEIIFRNMSKYALDISAKELEERFVRGDKSRHMEGNGLGLSIAKSLTQLQNGSMEIVTDGDLFKVVIRFPVLENSQ